MRVGESPLDALRREIREETSLDNIGCLIPCIIEAGVHELHDYLFLDYTARYRGGEIGLDPSEHDDWRWVSREALGEARSEKRSAAGVPYYIYSLAAGEFSCSHSPEQLAFALGILEYREAGQGPSLRQAQGRQPGTGC